MTAFSDASRILSSEGPLAGMGIAAPCPMEPCPAEHAHILSAFAYACCVTGQVTCHHGTHREHCSFNSKLKHGQGVVVRQ